MGQLVTPNMIAGDGALRREMHAGRRLHRVPDGVVIASLRDQLTREVGTTGWYAVVFFSDGRGVARGAHPGVPEPDITTLQLMAGIAIAINRHEARDGHWVVALNDREGEIVALWRDGDGDAQLAWEIGAPASLIDWTEIHLAAQAAQAIDTWKEQHARVDVRPSQKRRFALERRRPH